MNKDYIIFQINLDGDKVDLGYSQQFELTNEIDNRLVPNPSSELIQFCKIELDEVEDPFADSYSLISGKEYKREDFINTDGTPKLLSLDIISAEKKRFCVTYGRYKGYLYFYNILSYRKGVSDVWKQGMVGMKISAYFFKQMENENSLLFSQTCCYTYKRKKCYLEGLKVGQYLDCIPTSYVFNIGVFVNFNQGTGLIPASELENWDMLLELYPIGIPISLKIKLIDTDEKKILFYSRNEEAAKGPKQNITIEDLEVGKRIPLKIVWVEKDMIKVKFDKGFGEIRMDLLPKVLAKNAITIKKNIPNFVFDAIVLENGGKKELSALEAVKKDFENISAADRNFGLKEFEVVISEQFEKEGKKAYYLIVRWKGLYGYIIISDTELEKYYNNIIPRNGELIRLQVVSYSDDRQLVLKSPGKESAEKQIQLGESLERVVIYPQGVPIKAEMPGFHCILIEQSLNKDDYQSIQAKKKVECPFPLKVISIDYEFKKAILAAGENYISDPTALSDNEFPISVTPLRSLTSNDILVRYEDKNYILNLGISDRPLVNLVKKMIFADSCALKAVKAKSVMKIPYLIWNAEIDDVDLQAIENKETIEVTTQLSNKTNTIFYIRKLIGIIDNKEFIFNKLPLPKWGQKLKVRYSGEIIDGNQHLLFHLVSQSDIDEVKNVPLPIINIDNNSYFNNVEGFVISSIVKQVNDNNIIFNSPNPRYSFIMDQSEWCDDGSPMPRQLGYETIPIYFSIIQNADEDGIVKLSHKALMNSPEYRLFHEDEPDFPHSLYTNKHDCWEKWAKETANHEIQKWRLWRIQGKWAIFRYNSLFLAVQCQKLDYSLGVRVGCYLAIGQEVSFQVLFDNRQYPWESLTPIMKDDLDYDSHLPQIGSLIVCKLYRKDGDDWLLSGNGWIGRLPVEEIISEQEGLLVANKTLYLSVEDYDSTHREIICSMRSYQEQFTQDKVKEDCIISKIDKTGISVNINGVDFAVEKINESWKQIALNNIFQIGDLVKVWVKGTDWEKGKPILNIVGNQDGLFVDLVPIEGERLCGTIKYYINTPDMHAYLLKFDNEGIGLMPGEESMENHDRNLYYQVGERVEVSVIGIDVDTKLPLVSYNRCHPIQFDENNFSIDELYEGTIIKIYNEGMILKLLDKGYRIFIPIRMVYQSISDYNKHYFSKGQSIKVVYKGGKNFETDMIKPMNVQVSKNEKCKLTIFSICQNGLNTWNEDGFFVWIPKDHICYKRNYDIEQMHFRRGQTLDAYYLSDYINPTIMYATLKPNKLLSDTYPIGTILEGNIYEINFDEMKYTIDFGYVWGNLDFADASWKLTDNHLELNQKVKVTVVRLPVSGQKLSVSMLSPDILGPIGGVLEGMIKTVETDTIHVDISGIDTIADAAITQNNIGLDNFGKIRIHVDDKVRTILKEVDIVHRTINVDIMEIM